MRRDKAFSSMNKPLAHTATETRVIIMWGGKRGLGNVAVYLDNQRVGGLSHGGQKVFEVQPGRHNIYVTWWAIPTRTLPFDIEPGDKIDFVCKAAGLFGLMTLRRS
jgi:hypothetical protein